MKRNTPPGELDVEDDDEVSRYSAQIADTGVRSFVCLREQGSAVLSLSRVRGS
ncbi:MAG: hypothetical protein WBV31_03065 [Terriglobales bacterium]